MNFTEEQIKAITLDGTNILLSAGAGSGKTAVLTERVIEKLKKGVHIDELLLLTFTNNASLEMMDRIKKKIKEVDYLKDEALKVDSSYITTFDGFFLRLVKNLPYKIDITDEGIIKMIKTDILDEIFNEFYEKNDKDFIDLVLTFNVKNDVSLRKKIIYLDNQLSLLSFKEDYLNDSINKYAPADFEYEFFASDIEDINKLYEESEIFLITHRSNHFFKNPKLITVDWLNKKGIKYDKLIFTKSNNNSPECLENGIDIMFDDEADKCKFILNAGIESYLVKTRYNEKYSLNVPIVNNWEEIYNLICKKNKYNVILDSDTFNEADD